MIRISVAARLVLCLAVVWCMSSSSAFAQGGSIKTAISGTVVDAAGGAIPGATIAVKNNETSVAQTVVTNGVGAFSVPALEPGIYTVTVTLTGFKTAVVNNQRLTAANPVNIKVALEVGGFSDIVEVKGGSELVQTQSGAVSSTLFTEQLKTLPLQTRNALYAVTFLPGVDSFDGPRNSTIAGLPEQNINITLDGVNVNNNQDRAGDGFYAMVRPQLDSIEQVTLTTATQGADSAGQGAVQIRFQTRSGTNTFRGTAYEYFRNKSLNTNYWFNEKNNLPRNELTLHQFGGTVGGPIVIPKVFDGRNRAFFFFNYEEFYQPASATRTRTILNPNAQQGLFSYNVTVNGQVVTRSVDVLQLAAANGQVATQDPTVQGLLARMRDAAGSTGNITTPSGSVLTQSFIYQAPGKGVEHLPTTKLNFNLGQRHRLDFTYIWQEINRYPDLNNNGESRFPGFVNFSNYLSTRLVTSGVLRSTLTSNVVNEFIVGGQYSPGYFGANLVPSMFEDQGNYALGFPLGLTSATQNASGEQPRTTPNWNIDNNVNWQMGRHSVSFGGSMTRVSYDQTAVTMAPSVNFGVQSGIDPADTMFTTANFEGASNGNLNDARALYALLTGRVTSINASSRLNENSEYVYNGPTSNLLGITEFGAFMQDSWRIHPTLTLNAGVRWEVQMPVEALNSNYSASTVPDACGISGLGNGPFGRPCNMFNPGVINAPNAVSQYHQYVANTPGYATDWNNLAPNVSAAWRPNVTSGFLRTILGDPEQATLRAGFSIAYNRNGMQEFQNVYGGNPGRTVSSNRNNTIGNLVPAGGQWPLLYRDKSRLGPPPACDVSNEVGCIPTSVAYPLRATTGDDINIFNPDIQLSHTKSYQIGFQRSLSPDMAIEVRYVGNRNTNGWLTENWNERDIYKNGFLDEFQLAQANLASHVAAGCGTTGQAACSFAYRGPGTGTSPLPIYLAHFNAASSANAGNAAAYTGTNWTNTTFIGRLNQRQPAPTTARDDLFTSATFRTNMLAAGLARNFWVMNPDIDAANVTTSGTFTRYHSVQVEVRRRLSRGLQVNGSYTWARQFNSDRGGIQFDWFARRTNNVPHSFKVNGYYEVPFGRGRRFGSDSGTWLDTIVGGWSVSMTGRVQVRTLNISNARLVGMSNDELQKEYRIRIDESTRTVFMMADDIILNTRRAYSTSATSATGYGSLGVPEGRYIAPASYPGCVRVNPGDCGEPINIFLTAPPFTRFDLTTKKQFKLGGRRTFDIQFDINNVFEAINFTPVFNPGGGETIFQTNSAYTDIGQSFDPGGRLGQIIARFGW